MYNYEKNAFFGPFKGLKNTITKAVQNRKAIKGAENMIERHSKHIEENFNNIEAVKKRTNVLKSVNSQRSNIQKQMGDTWLAKGIKKRQDARLNKRMEALKPESPLETYLKNPPRRRSMPQAAPATQEAKGSLTRPMLAGGIMGAGGYHLYDKYTNDPNRMYKQAGVKADLINAAKNYINNVKALPANIKQIKATKDLLKAHGGELKRIRGADGSIVVVKRRKGARKADFEANKPLMDASNIVMQRKSKPEIYDAFSTSAGLLAAGSLTAQGAEAILSKQANLSSLVKATKELAPNLKKLVNKKTVGYKNPGGSMYSYSFKNDPKALKAVGKGLILPGTVAATLAGAAAMGGLTTRE